MAVLVLRGSVKCVVHLQNLLGSGLLDSKKLLAKIHNNH